MAWEDVFKLFLASVSGAGIIILSLSNWLGKVWAKRIEKEHQAKLNKELEFYRSELEKLRNDYQRFSSKKFTIIEETWTAMHGIVDELTIYNPNHGDYNDFLLKSLDTITKYHKIISKNSLYFDDDIQKLLIDYISTCSDVTHYASEGLKNNIGDNKKMSEIFLEVGSKATERENILKEIKVKFKKELGSVY